MRRPSNSIACVPRVISVALPAPEPSWLALMTYLACQLHSISVVLLAV